MKFMSLNQYFVQTLEAYARNVRLKSSQYKTKESKG